MKNFCMNIGPAVLVTNALESQLSAFLKESRHTKVFLITEETCHEKCLPLIRSSAGLKEIPTLVLPAGEQNKNIINVEKVWHFLSAGGADRSSLVINLGGGMLTDLAGFAAATFKRGVDCVNIPTTLLSQVDASVGGKTGFNLAGLKNEIGVIVQPKMVLIDTRFLKTIDQENLLSGAAEMIKHGLIHSMEHLADLMNFNFKKPAYSNLAKLIGDSVAIKNHFVTIDPYEKGLRKALNFGHTVGHALESVALESKRPLHHGYAVAYGMIVELYLSHLVTGFPIEDLQVLTHYLKRLYGNYTPEGVSHEMLYELMKHDKKNEGSRINFTLLSSVGEVAINCHCDKELVFDALDYFTQLMNE